MRWINVTVVTILVAAIVIFAVQNFQITAVSFLNFRISAPLAVLMVLIYLLGMVTGGSAWALCRWALEGTNGYSCRSLALPVVVSVCGALGVRLASGAEAFSFGRAWGHAISSACLSSAAFSFDNVTVVQPCFPRHSGSGVNASGATVHFSSCSSGANLKFAVSPSGANVA